MTITCACRFIQLSVNNDLKFWCIQPCCRNPSVYNTKVQNGWRSSDSELDRWLAWPWELFLKMCNMVFSAVAHLWHSLSIWNVFVLQVFPVVEGLWLSHSLPGSVSLQRWGFPAGAAARTDGGLRRHHWSVPVKIIIYYTHYTGLRVGYDAHGWWWTLIRSWGDAGGPPEHRALLRGREETLAGRPLLPEMWPVQQSTKPSLFSSFTVKLLRSRFFTSFSFWPHFQALNHFLKCSSTEDNKALDLAIETVSRSKFKSLIFICGFYSIILITIPGGSGQGKFSDQSTDRFPDGWKWWHTKGKQNFWLL